MTRDWLTEGKTAHQAGDLVAARAAYDRVITGDPRHAEALYLMGALEYQSGNDTAALSCLDACLRVAPAHVPALSAKAAALIAARRPAEAVAIREKIVTLSPDDSHHWHDLGVVRSRTGDLAGAANAHHEALARNPSHQAAAAGLARALLGLRKLPNAAQAYDRAITLNPRNVGLRDEYAAVLFDVGRDNDAEAMVRSAIDLDPEAPAPRTNLGRMLVRKAGQAEEALRQHDLCLAKLPDYANAHSNRAAALYVLSRLTEAEQSCRKALSLNANLADAHSNLGNILHRRGDTAAAIASYDRALAIDPALAEAQLNRALAELTIGQFAAGWRDFEARWQCRGYQAPNRGLGLPRLGSDDRPPATVLVWGEQGIGDEIVYGGMALDLAKRGFDLILECDSRLVSLWQRSHPGMTVVGRNMDVAGVARRRSATRQIPIASVGALTRRTAADFPSGSGFLVPDQRRADQFRASLCKAGTRLVGLSWSSITDETGRAKSIPLTHWHDLCNAADVTVVSLQYGDTAAEIAEANTRGTSIKTVPGLDLRHDLDGVAALIAACDIVVTVSNATAHLAGAIGAPTCVLAPSGVGRFWYWQTGATTPIYPSVRIYRQASDGDWTNAIVAATQHAIAPPPP